MLITVRVLVSACGLLETSYDLKIQPRELSNLFNRNSCGKHLLGYFHICFFTSFNSSLRTSLSASFGMSLSQSLGYAVFSCGGQFSVASFLVVHILVVLFSFRFAETADFKCNEDSACSYSLRIPLY